MHALVLPVGIAKREALIECGIGSSIGALRRDSANRLKFGESAKGASRHAVGVSDAEPFAVAAFEEALVAELAAVNVGVPGFLALADVACAAAQLDVEIRQVESLFVSVQVPVHENRFVHDGTGPIGGEMRVGSVVGGEGEHGSQQRGHKERGS